MFLLLSGARAARPVSDPSGTVGACLVFAFGIRSFLALLRGRCSSMRWDVLGLVRGQVGASPAAPRRTAGLRLWPGSGEQPPADSGKRFSCGLERRAPAISAASEVHVFCRRRETI